MLVPHACIPRLLAPTDSFHGFTYLIDAAQMTSCQCGVSKFRVDPAYSCMCLVLFCLCHPVFCLCIRAREGWLSRPSGGGGMHGVLVLPSSLSSPSASLLLLLSQCTYPFRFCCSHPRTPLPCFWTDARTGSSSKSRRSPLMERGRQRRTDDHWLIVQLSG